VSINGRLYARLPGRARSAVIDLNGRPPQTVRLRVTALTRDGRTLGTRRTYVTCTPRLKHPPLPTLRLMDHHARKQEDEDRAGAVRADLLA
jgi:hypothetical protein